MSHFFLPIPWVCETQICEPSYSIFGQGDYATDTPRRINVDLMSILRRYVEKKTSISFHVISTYFFDAISMGEKSTSFRRTFFNVTLISEDFVSTYLLRCNFDERKIHFVSTHFVRRNFDERNIDVILMCFFFISMDKNSTMFRCIFWRNLDGKLM